MEDPRYRTPVFDAREAFLPGRTGHCIDDHVYLGIDDYYRVSRS